MSLTCSNVGGPVRDRVSVITEALKQQLQSDTLGRWDTLVAIVNISKYKE